MTADQTTAYKARREIADPVISDCKTKGIIKHRSIGRVLFQTYPEQFGSADKARDFVRKVLKNDVKPLIEKVENITVSNGYEKIKILSAWDSEGGIMDIDRYCDHYKLPRNDIHSYKLVSHTGTPFYNIVFNQTVTGFEFSEDLFAEIVRKNVNRINIVPTKTNGNYIDRLVYTDAHIGMATNQDGFALYPVEWNEKEINNRLIKCCDFIITNRKGSTLIIDDLGDFVDGYDAETVRKGHKLPQNMDNQQMFDQGVLFKVGMIDRLISHYDKITVNNICEDNHAGSFGYIVNSAFKMIVESKYENVSVTNYRRFINHYFVDDFCFMISHGKDSKDLKFGFKPHLDAIGSGKIDQYCKQYGLYKEAEHFEFSKGDSHQALYDSATSDDFDYFNYPAFSPSSQWVQVGFQKGRSGFVLQQINLTTKVKTLIPYYF